MLTQIEAGTGCLKVWAFGFGWTGKVSNTFFEFIFPSKSIYNFSIKSIAEKDFLVVTLDKGESIQISNVNILDIKNAIESALGIKSLLKTDPDIKPIYKEKAETIGQIETSSCEISALLELKKNGFFILMKRFKSEIGQSSWLRRITF